MNMKYVCSALAALFLMAASGGAAAGAAEQLRRFVSSAHSAEGEFRQTVTGESGRPPQQASGKFAFSRPGKFRWEYEQPYPQLLVADGERLWSWDRDLNQVTVRPLGNALGATPAAILFGQGAIERDFELVESKAGEAEADGELAWVEAKPRQTDDERKKEWGGGFQLMRFGFAGDRLQRMSLRDNFGQTTVIVFTHLRLNPALDAGSFRFEPPPGADVLGDLPVR
ncbi:MAG: outer membrane lipoprotein chaperone LolA [Azoarcus sp.]|jgi:outer membrane lipoprotein carrier protein|nr:outer membrane lipoprotein chaperone LolA [Azoarcus sp.]